jgi:hypothetical protein
VHDHLVGLLGTLKMTTLMAGLATRLTARPTPQALGAGGLASPSNDGSRDELREFCTSRRFNSATSPRNSTISAAYSTTSASRSSRDSPPLDTQQRSRRRRYPLPRPEQSRKIGGFWDGRSITAPANSITVGVRRRLAKSTYSRSSISRSCSACL